MAKFERYDAREDSRFFDGGELEDDDEEGSRLPLLLVVGLLFVAAFAGVVWLAYTQGVQRGRADAPRMLVAATSPEKVVSASPGGSEAPYKGLKIYQQPAPPEDEDTESAPQPPTPKPAVPMKMAQTPIGTAPMAASAAASGVSAPETQPMDVETAPPPSGMATKPPRALHAVSEPPPALKPSTVASKPEVAPKAEATPKPQAAPKPVPAEIVKPAAQTVAALAPATEAAAGPALQIGAYKSEAEASAAWQASARKHPMVNGFQSAIVKADLGDKGVWYRLRLGTFSDKAAAAAFCDKLKADGGNCFLAR